MPFGGKYALVQGPGFETETRSSRDSRRDSFFGCKLNEQEQGWEGCNTKWNHSFLGE